MTIAKWIKKAVTEAFDAEAVDAEVVDAGAVEAEAVGKQEAETALLELDEMWTCVGQRQRKVWLWLAVERASRRLVGWVLGCRGAATGQRLFQALPTRYQHSTTYYTDAWKAYATVLPAAAHRPSARGSGQASLVEALTCSLRHRCGVLVRKSCSFSKSLPMHHARINLCIENHNKQITTD